MKKLIIFLFIILFFSIFLLIILNIFLSKSSTIPQTKIATPSAKIQKNNPEKTFSIKTIFEEKENLKSFAPEKTITLLATGDVIPARGVNWAVVAKKDFTYPFQKTAELLKSADITLINLESPLTKNCELASTGFTFCGDQRHVQGLIFAGVDVANLANNHISNFGFDGLKQTEDLLTANGIEWSGFSHLSIEEAKGTKFGFLGYNGVGEKIDEEEVKKEVSDAKTKVDVLVVSVHWGKEYELLPMAASGIAPDDPVQIGHLLVDSGADLVVGNHPHWVQGVEFYKGKFITYAHGNFIFDQTWSEETQEGAIGKYIFYNKKLVNVSFIPIVVDKSYQPKFADETTGKKILEQMEASSKEIAKEAVLTAK